MMIKLFVLLLSGTALCQLPGYQDHEGSCQHTSQSSSNRQGQDPNYWGCYANDDDDMLNGAWKTDPRLTHQNCFAFCEQRSYRFAGMQSGTHCHCTNSFNRRRYVPVREIDCNAQCSGDFTFEQRCGGAQRVSLYALR